LDQPENRGYRSGPATPRNQRTAGQKDTEESECGIITEQISPADGFQPPLTSIVTTFVNCYFPRKSKDLKSFEMQTIYAIMQTNLAELTHQVHKKSAI
jgi:hypothetical protein